MNNIVAGIKSTETLTLAQLESQFLNEATSGTIEVKREDKNGSSTKEFTANLHDTIKELHLQRGTSATPHPLMTVAKEVVRQLENTGGQRSQLRAINLGAHGTESALVNDEKRKRRALITYAIPSYFNPLSYWKHRGVNLPLRVMHGLTSQAIAQDASYKAKHDGRGFIGLNPGEQLKVQFEVRSSNESDALISGSGTLNWPRKPAKEEKFISKQRNGL